MIEVHNLGLIEYSKALQEQDEALNRVNTNHEEILVCEHPPVITVGRAAGSASEVFAKDIPVFEIPRGGRATLHLPGQVVVYPILDLNKRGRDLHQYMRVLESAIIDTLADFRIDATSIEGKTGVWVKKSLNTGGERKIASLGIAVKNWKSYHGVALNVCCDLKQFSKINPCGFSADVMTSMIEEMPASYVSTWKIEPRDLFERTTKRLTENMLARFENPEFFEGEAANEIQA